MNSNANALQHPNEQPPAIHLVTTTDYPAFNEIIDSFEEILKAKQHPVSRGYLSVKKEAINIIFGAHLLHPEQVKALHAPHIIIYNLEQIHPFNPWCKQNYIQLMKNHQVWDYNLDNITQLKLAGIKPRTPAWVPVGYHQTLERIAQKPEVEKDIDVLFYGLMSERRLAIMTTLQNAGFNVVHTAFGEKWSSSERDDYIARSKIVLNMAYADYSQVFEIARVSYLFANKAFVLSENLSRAKIAHHQIPPELQACIGFFDLNIEEQNTNIIDICRHYLNNPELRQEMSEQAYAYLQSIPLTSQLHQAIDDYTNSYINNVNNINNINIENNVENVLDIPRAIQIGSGKSWRYDCLNVDIEPRYKPDMLFDLNKPFAFDQAIQTWRFGEISIPKNYFHYILSEHVFEHINDLVQAMTNCLDLLTEGGVLELETPYDLSHGAWQDPTHVRALNENSWAYYTQWYWYIGWTDYRFDVIEHKYNLSLYGQELLAQNNGDVEAIKHVPRAVDSFRAKLRKRATTDVEKEANKAYYPGYNLQMQHYQQLSLVDA